MATPHQAFTWKRKGGYEVSSKGDKRFSAFYAYLPDGCSVEYHYQVNIKGYVSIQEGKGKPPVDLTTTREAQWRAYLGLWRVWAHSHIPLMRELYLKAKEKDYCLSDCFASTEINQARALSVILNELVAKGE